MAQRNVRFESQQSGRLIGEWRIAAAGKRIDARVDADQRSVRDSAVDHLAVDSRRKQLRARAAATLRVTDLADPPVRGVRGGAYCAPIDQHHDECAVSPAIRGLLRTPGTGRR
jgi:hypothetical protein